MTSKRLKLPMEEQWFQQMEMFSREKPPPPSGFICIYFCNCLGLFFIFFPIKLSWFPRLANIFLGFCGKIWIHLYYRHAQIYEAPWARGRRWTPSCPQEGSESQMTWQWPVYIWLWGKGAEKSRRARSCFWGSLYLFYFFLCLTLQHTHLGGLQWSAMPHGVSGIFKNTERDSTDILNVFSIVSGRRCSSQVGTGVCLQASLSLLETLPEKTMTRGGLPWPKAWRQPESLLPFPSTYSNYRPAPATIIMV